MLAWLVWGILAVSAPAATDACADRALEQLQNRRADSDLRAELAQCLSRRELARPEVALALLKILKDKSEDVLLREDIASALAATQWRRKVKVEAALAPQLDAQDRKAVDHTVSGANDLLAVASAVNSMDEIVPVTKFEGEFLRAFGELAEGQETPVLLRVAAVAALEKTTTQLVESGVYEERNLRVAQNTLREIVDRDEDDSYFTGAAAAYGRLASAGVPLFAPGRALASTPAARGQKR